MNEPTWLPRDVIVAVQEELLARFGGLAGIRDEGLLESALSRPQHLYAYENPSIFELGAAYAHGLAKNHPFGAGNKRIAFMAAYIFLGANGHKFGAPEEEAVVQTLGLASGDVDASTYAAWLEQSCVRASD
jgi:death-on-curing protein